MEASCIYVDESGNTGENLIDPAQPVFVLGSVSLDDASSAALVTRVTRQLPIGHGEPKYTSLAKTNVGRNALIECFSALPPNMARFYAANKRFCRSSPWRQVCL
jgi:hypothetical protein